MSHFEDGAKPGEVCKSSKHEENYNAIELWQSTINGEHKIASQDTSIFPYYEHNALKAMATGVSTRFELGSSSYRKEETFPRELELGNPGAIYLENTKAQKDWAAGDRYPYEEHSIEGAELTRAQDKLNQILPQFTVAPDCKN